MGRKPSKALVVTTSTRLAYGWDGVEGALSDHATSDPPTSVHWHVQILITVFLYATVERAGYKSYVPW